jgi:hypothetical protein
MFPLALLALGSALVVGMVADIFRPMPRAEG